MGWQPMSETAARELSRQLAQQRREAAKAARDQRVAALLAEAERAKAERIHKERTDMSQAVITAIREQAATLIASGQSESDAESNAARAYFYAHPELLTEDAVEALPKAAQAAYDKLHDFTYLADPEGDARKAAAGAKADEDAAAAVTEEYRIKRVAKVVNGARSEQATDIDAYMKRGASREEAERRYPLNQYLTEVPAADIDAVDAAEAKTKADWFRIGDDSGGEEAAE